MTDKPTTPGNGSRLPRPGLRMIKTTLAVLISVLTVGILYPVSNGFYAGISAVLSTQTNLKNSWPFARDRIVGTFIGGLYGLIVLLILQAINNELAHPIYLAIMAISILPLIYLIVLLKQYDAVYITCVVYLSLVLSTADRAPLEFAVARMLETTLGIFVSLGINAIPFPRDDRSKS